ncbi:hypothetical protein UPYG_G00103850 [Umbra pygmaea]|uniref:Uncharacterized protein n=1 Tax=Umbra pygmaea TaxID=75934 RepID=A0ABD0XR48_UMBPY
MAIRPLLSVCLLFLMVRGSSGYRYTDGSFVYSGGVNSPHGSSSTQYKYGPVHRGYQHRHGGEEASEQSEAAPQSQWSGKAMQEAFVSYNWNEPKRFVRPNYKTASSALFSQRKDPDGPTNGNANDWLLRKHKSATTSESQRNQQTKGKMFPLVPENPGQVSSNQNLPEITNIHVPLNSHSNVKWIRVKVSRPIPQYSGKQEGHGTKSPFVPEQPELSNRQNLWTTNRPGAPKVDETLKGNSGDVLTNLSIPLPTGSQQIKDKTLPSVDEQQVRVFSSQMPPEMTNTSTSPKVSTSVSRPEQTPNNSTFPDMTMRSTLEGSTTNALRQTLKPSEKIPESSGNRGQANSPSVSSTLMPPALIERTTQASRIPEKWWQVVKPGQMIPQSTKSPLITEQQVQDSSSLKLQEMTKRPTLANGIPEDWWQMVKPGQMIPQSTGNRQGQGTTEQVPWIRHHKWEDLAANLKPRSDDIGQHLNIPMVPYPVLPLSSIIQTRNSYERRKAIFSHIRFSPRETMTFKQSTGVKYPQRKR